MGCALSAPAQGKVMFPSLPRPAEEVERAEARDAIRLRAANAAAKAERAAARKHRLKLRAETAAKHATQSALEAQRAQEILLRLDDPEFHPLRTVDISETQTINTVQTLSIETLDESSKSDYDKKLGPYTQTFEDNVIPRSCSIQYYAAQDDDTTLSSCEPVVDSRKQPSVRDVARIFESLSTQEEEQNPLYAMSNSSKLRLSRRANYLREIAQQGGNAELSSSSDSDFSALTQAVSVDRPENFSLQPSVSDYSHMFDFDLDSEPQERVCKLPSVRRQLPAQVQTRRRKTFCFGGPDWDCRSSEGVYTDTYVRTPCRAVQSDLGKIV